MPERADEQGATAGTRRWILTACSGNSAGQGHCATMERCVPKDCTNDCVTLPKRLGEFLAQFSIRDKFLNTLVFLQHGGFSGFVGNGVGMGIALTPSASLPD
jgi:hypothetical protein